MIKNLALLLILLINLDQINAQQYGSFKDSRDGKVYKTVKIGQQEWMAENLNTSLFRNGDPIPEAKTKEEWEKAGENKKPAWCYYKFDSSGLSYIGKLYNGYAVLDQRGLAPIGWHITFTEEWDSMNNNLNQNKLHIFETSSWGTELLTNYQSQSKESGLSVSPNITRSASGIFSTVSRLTASFWLFKEEDKIIIQIISPQSRARYTPAELFKTIGAPVRCIKDNK
jgi:uncharacterized protein (TIGR02145 family)